MTRRDHLLCRVGSGKLVPRANGYDPAPVHRQAVLQRGVKLVVADPRAIDITEFASLHLRHTPGTDVALLNGLMHIIVQQGWHDQSFIATRTENFEVFRETLDTYAPARVAALTAGAGTAAAGRAAVGADATVVAAGGAGAGAAAFFGAISVRICSRVIGPRR